MKKLGTGLRADAGVEGPGRVYVLRFRLGPEPKGCSNGNLDAI